MGYEITRPVLPLQVSYIQEGDPKVAVAMLVVIIVAAGIIILFNISKHGVSKTGSFLSSPKQPKHAHHSSRSLRSAVRAYGFSKVQLGFLEDIFKKSGGVDPTTAFSNPAILDLQFKRSYHSIERSAETEEIAEEEKSILFSIRNRIGEIGGKTSMISSTRSLPNNTTASLTTQKGESYPIRFISTKGNYILSECPRNSVGLPIRFSRGARVQLSILTKASQGYKIYTRVLGIQKNAGGPYLQLAHSEEIRSLPNRIHRRIQTRISCIYSLAHLEERGSGKTKEKKLVVDGKKQTATIMDISAGGCALKSPMGLQTGAYLKVSFEDIHDRTLVFLGRIVRTNRTGSLGEIMHIQFVRIPRKTLNAVNAIVYEYDQD